MQDPNCLFCRIVAGEIPADIVHETERTISFRDIAPKAPVHVLVIPKKAIPRLVDAEAHDKELLGHLLLAAGKIAEQLGVQDAFRRCCDSSTSARSIPPAKCCVMSPGR